METYQDLIVWQKSLTLVKTVYEMTATFPDAEKFGLINQMRRAAVSIPSNIAEGFARKGNNEFMRFLRIAYGSGAELETQLRIAKELKFTSERDFDTVHMQLIEVKKMLNKLISNLSVRTKH